MHIVYAIILKSISFLDLSGLIQVEDCPVGTRLPRNCEPCPAGFYSDKKGLWKDCLPCEKGLTTLPEDGTKCVGKDNGTASNWAASRENLYLGFSTRSDTNRTALPKTIVRGLIRAATWEKQQCGF